MDPRDGQFREGIAILVNWYASKKQREEVLADFKIKKEVQLCVVHNDRQNWSQNQSNTLGFLLVECEAKRERLIFVKDYPAMVQPQVALTIVPDVVLPPNLMSS